MSIRSLALFLGLLAGALCARPAEAQTPTPLAYWQFSAGEVLASLAGPLPDWRITVGPGVEVQPTYPGAKRYRVEPAGILDIRYRDVAFLSDGEGLGVNLLHGKGYRAGVAVGYDLGRNHHDDPRVAHLADVDAAPEAKVFAQYFLEPVVLTADLRRAVGGHDGIIGDIGAYLPLPVAPHTFLFTGPSLTMANDRYMQSYFGVDAAHARASGLREFHPAGGLRNAGFGATAVYLHGDHWLLNMDLAYQRLLGDAERSPITASRNQVTADVVVGYRF